MTGRPTYGVLPYADELWLDAEDSLQVVAHRVVGTPAPPRGTEWLKVAAVRPPGSPTPPTSRPWRASPACWCAGSPTPPSWLTPT